jgi:ribosomal protein S18 acetylase RimI-like enzyme
MGSEVRPATASDLTAIAAAVARAFEDDPVMRYLRGGGDAAPERSEPFFRLLGRQQLRHGFVYTTDARDAAAFWAPPGKWKAPPTTLLKALPVFVRLWGRHVVRNLGVLATVEKLHPHEPHYYLSVLGTDPVAQGKGIGSSLMRPVLERCDEEGLGAYLESSKESNLAFYARHGFEVTDHVDLPDGPTIWPMWRAPR